MILSAHQPAYIPWIGYFNKIATSNKFIVMDDVQFEKNSYINRNQIQTNQGTNIWLTIPVQTKGYQDKTIKEIEIDNNTNWKKKHWESIYYNYKKSSYFSRYETVLKSIYNKDWLYLSDIINYQLDLFLNILDIKTPIEYLSSLDIKTKKQELIKDMCNKTNCDCFIFGSNGFNYAEESFFGENNIEQKFQKIPENISRFSIIHLLMTEELENIKKQINESFSFSSSSR